MKKIDAGVFGRTIVASSAAAVLLGGIALAAAPAEASGYSPKDNCSPADYAQWGANCDGFHLIIKNETGHKLTFTGQTLSGYFDFESGVSDYVTTIEPGETTTDGQITSQKLSAGGPSDIMLTYDESETGGVQKRYVHLNNDGGNNRTQMSSCFVGTRKYVEFGLWSYNYQIGKVDGCPLYTFDLTHKKDPIVVTFPAA